MSLRLESYQGAITIEIDSPGRYAYCSVVDRAMLDTEVPMG
jgi:hypothetical protein